MASRDAQRGMTPEEAVSRLHELGFTHEPAEVLVHAARLFESVTTQGVTILCHPGNGQYRVTES